MYKYTNLTASGLVKTGDGGVLGIIINSNSSGTIKMYDSLTASGTVFNDTISLGATERNIAFFGKTFYTGLYVEIGGTANISVVYGDA